MFPVGEDIHGCCNAIFLPYNRFAAAAFTLLPVGGRVFLETEYRHFLMAGAVDFLQLDYCHHLRGPGVKRKNNKAAFTCRH